MDNKCLSNFSSVQFSWVAQECPTFCDPMDCSTPGFPSQSITYSQSLLKLMSIASVMPSNQFILCRSFSSYLQSFSASGSFPMSWFFTSGGQSTGVSASTSVLPMNIQDWFPLGWTGWILLQSKRLSRVFSNTTKVSIPQRSAFFTVQLSHPHMTNGKNQSFDEMDLCW